MAALPVLDWSPFDRDEAYKLALADNWPKLLQILAPIVSHDFAVTDPASQALIDDVRLVLDSSSGCAVLLNLTVIRRYVVETITLHENEEGAADVIKALLAVGVDPDKGNDAEVSRPSHICGWLGQVDMAHVLLLCRPNMAAKNKNGDSVLEAALCLNYSDDGKFPGRKARCYVAKFIKHNGFETGFPTLAELALQKKWFAVKNLVRRQVVKESEFIELLHGKTAAEWCECFGQSLLAKEIKYYQQPMATRFQNCAAQFLRLATENPALQAKVAKLDKESKEKDEKIAELSETVQALSSGEKMNH